MPDLAGNSATEREILVSFVLDSITRGQTTPMKGFYNPDFADGLAASAIVGSIIREDGRNPIICGYSRCGGTDVAER